MRNLDEGPRARLIDTTLLVWEEFQGDQISARAVSREAGLAVSAIDYYFGSCEHLYLAAQHHAAKLAHDWLDDRLAQFAALGPEATHPAASASLIACLIDDWTEGQRPLAMAWREACAAARMGQDIAAHARWCTLWREFWARTASILGVPRQAEVLAAFFDGEANQHLMRWNRAFDRLLLEETVTSLLMHLGTAEQPPSLVGPAYRREALRQYRRSLGPDEEPHDTLDEAAAAVLAQSGAAGLTFRAVAARAGTTLGRTSHHFGSKSRLLTRAFDRLFRQALARHGDWRQDDSDTLLGRLVAHVAAGGEPILRAWDEITLFIARSDDHLPLRGLMRSYHDPEASLCLQRLMNADAEPPQALMAAFTSITRGLEHLAVPLDRPAAEALCRSGYSVFLPRDARDA